MANTIKGLPTSAGTAPSASGGATEGRGGEIDVDDGVGADDGVGDDDRGIGVGRAVGVGDGTEDGRDVLVVEDIDSNAPEHSPRGRVEIPSLASVVINCMTCGCRGGP